MRCGIQRCGSSADRYWRGDSMYAIAPDAGITKSCVSNACFVRESTSRGATLPMSHTVRVMMRGSIVCDAAGFRQIGARTSGLQNVASLVDPSNERNTAHVNPLVP